MFQEGELLQGTIALMALIALFGIHFRALREVQAQQMKGKKNYNKANNKPKRPAGRSSGKIKSHASPPSKNNPNEKRNQQGESIFLINMVQQEPTKDFCAGTEARSDASEDVTASNELRRGESDSESDSGSSLGTTQAPSPDASSSEEETEGVDEIEKGADAVGTSPAQSRPEEYWIGDHVEEYYIGEDDPVEDDSVREALDEDAWFFGA
eukprot:g16406.t1